MKHKDYIEIKNTRIQIDLLIEILSSDCLYELVKKEAYRQFDSELKPLEYDECVYLYEYLDLVRME
jgi:hypothetical protein